MIDFVVNFHCVGVVYIPVFLLSLLTCEIYNFVTVESFQFINTISSIKFKAIHIGVFQIFRHPCFQIICYMYHLKDKIANVLQLKVLF